MSTAATTVPQGTPANSAAPGASAPLASMSVAKSAVVFLGVSVAGLVALRLAFGERELPGIRVDALEVTKIYLAYQAFNVPLKLIAFRYHGHAWSQTVLTFT